SQATLRIVKVFWGLDSALAYKRHFPAINWLNSYSLYTDLLSKWYKENADEQWMALRGRLMNMLQQEAELDEIVKLVGMDALSPGDRLKMETARSIREDFLQQDSFDDTDTHASLHKQFRMMQLVLSYYDICSHALSQKASIDLLAEIPSREAIGRFKFVPEKEVDARFDEITRAMNNEVKDVIGRSED
ncbi:MAG: V-type ATP synthase subunit A, partial [Clostridia bacterium]|nr:V-type ATP synthase subunit A [Clostridia bacterium]